MINNHTLKHAIEYVTAKDDDYYEIEGTTDIYDEKERFVETLYEWKISFDSDLTEIVKAPFVSEELEIYEIAEYFLEMGQDGYRRFDEKKLRDYFFTSLKNHIRSERLDIITTDKYKPKPEPFPDGIIQFKDPSGTWRTLGRTSAINITQPRGHYKSIPAVPTSFEINVKTKKMNPSFFDNFFNTIKKEKK